MTEKQRCHCTKKGQVLAKRKKKKKKSGLHSKASHRKMCTSRDCNSEEKKKEKHI